MKNGISKRAVAVGLAVDFGFTKLAYYTAGFIVGILITDFHSGTFRVDPVTFETLDLTVEAVAGFLGIIAGGAIAARMAGVNSVAHGGWVGGCNIIIEMVVLALFGPSKITYFASAEGVIALGTLVIASVPLGMLGGYLSTKSRR